MNFCVACFIRVCYTEFSLSQSIMSCSLWRSFFTVTSPLMLSPLLHESWGVFLLPSGAESPQAIQKLMGLSTSVKPHKSHYPHTPAPSGVTSPSLSSGRRPPTSPRHSAALRSHPVHLSPESSSVVSLSNIANYRRPQRTGKITPCPPNSVSWKGNIGLWKLPHLAKFIHFVTFSMCCLFSWMQYFYLSNPFFVFFFAWFIWLN